ncbi:MAG: FAD-binding oxidoreductase [Archangiaceae bacterium]|nr:FAD-binding oxidoreductase [Archangiaceae bacterium]
MPPPPDLVVWPSTEEEVQAVIAVARRRKLPVIPYGAGSGVCGGTWATHGGVALDLKRLDRIGPVDATARTVDAEAGVMGETLERRLASEGWQLGHTPSSIYMSTVGGWLAARSAGQLSSRWGKIEDMVLSVRAVLGTGERLETPERPFSGPDVAQLLIGSEGTLCAFTRARLRVFPLPEGRAFHGYDFKTVADGLEAIRVMFRAGLRPSVVRLYDPFDTAIVGDKPPHVSTTSPSQAPALSRELLPALFRVLAPQTLGRPGLMNRATHLLRKSRLVLVFEGEAARAADEDAAARTLCQRLGAVSLGPQPAEKWLASRYDVSYRMSKVFEGGAFADTFEVAAPWERVYEVYQKVREAVAAHAFVLCHFSHAYLEGCSLYFSFVGAAPLGQERERYESIWRIALSAAQSAGANVSHHHGVGLLKARALQESLGEGRHALKMLKDFFDPDGIMNPGKLGL